MSLHVCLTRHWSGPATAGRSTLALGGSAPRPIWEVNSEISNRRPRDRRGFFPGRGGRGSQDLRRRGLRRMGSVNFGL